MRSISRIEQIQLWWALFIIITEYWKFAFQINKPQLISPKNDCVKGYAEASARQVCRDGSHVEMCAIMETKKK